MARPSAAPLAAGLATAALAVAAAPAHAGFGTETILADGEWNSPSAVAVDAAGAVHLAYMKQHSTDSATKEIWYATNESGSWTFTRLTQNAVREEFPSLALDGDGNVHVAFHTGTGTSNKIRYTNDIGGWVLESAIDITPAGYKIVELEVGDDGTVHFVFSSQTTNFTDEIYYTTWTSDGGVAPLQNLSNSPGSESSPDLVIDGTGRVHVVYADGGTAGPLVYQHNGSGSFAVVATGVVGNVRDPMVLAAPDGTISIIYRIDDFLYAVDDGGTGTFGPPVPLYTGSYRPSFYENAAVDADGHRHIAFASNVGDNHGIFYVGETESGFAPPLMIGGADSGNQGASVAVNAAGALAVSHQLSGFDGIVFADLSVSTTQLGGGCAEDLDGSGDVGFGDILEIIGHWGFCPGCPQDLSSNDQVDFADILLVIAAWGPC